MRAQGEEEQSTERPHHAGIGRAVPLRVGSADLIQLLTDGEQVGGGDHFSADARLECIDHLARGLHQRVVVPLPAARGA